MNNDAGGERKISARSIYDLWVQIPKHKFFLNIVNGDLVCDYVIKLLFYARRLPPDEESKVEATNLLDLFNATHTPWIPDLFSKNKVISWDVQTIRKQDPPVDAKEPPPPNGFSLYEVVIRAQQAQNMEYVPVSSQFEIYDVFIDLQWKTRCESLRALLEPGSTTLPTTTTSTSSTLSSSSSSSSSSSASASASASVPVPAPLPASDASTTTTSAGTNVPAPGFKPPPPSGPPPKKNETGTPLTAADSLTIASPLAVAPSSSAPRLKPGEHPLAPNNYWNVRAIRWDPTLEREKGLSESAPHFDYVPRSELIRTRADEGHGNRKQVQISFQLIRNAKPPKVAISVPLFAMTLLSLGSLQIYAEDNNSSNALTYAATIVVAITAFRSVLDSKVKDEERISYYDLLFIFSILFTLSQALLVMMVEPKSPWIDTWGGVLVILLAFFICKDIREFLVYRWIMQGATRVVDASYIVEDRVVDNVGWEELPHSALKTTLRIAADARKQKQADLERARSAVQTQNCSFICVKRAWEQMLKVVCLMPSQRAPTSRKWWVKWLQRTGSARVPEATQPQSIGETVRQFRTTLRRGITVVPDIN